MKRLVCLVLLTLMLTGCAGAEERLPSYMRSLRRMCQDAEAETPELYIAFLP